MNFDVMIPAHGESLQQLRNLIVCITLQKTPGWKLKDLFLCSDNLQINHAFSDVSSITFISQEARKGCCIQISADCIPASENTFHYLLEPLRAPGIGAVTSKPVPYQPGFMWLPDLVWRCHEFVQPKLNAELFSFKRQLVDPLPESVVHDDAYIHSMLLRKHAQVIYEPRAVVFNSAPKTFMEFYQQRKKNVIGNLQLGKQFQEESPKAMRLRALVLMSIELLANAHGRLDYARKHVPKGLIGYSLESTKEVFA